ncbi:MAG TPA: hypothetical protein PLH92_09760 [Mycobacterium sp.]|uniref:hypothetical protein n=1 Tax=Mycolicibacterium sp. TaxID=2320850 RepID=UPI0025F661D0|nr:hypothetical protein [Mycolicibacterium sp.]HPX36919.1 hypothetical protein [Mycobacterium sp.]HQC76993.1 hypothetical protein [Mycobacterium sp.]
MHVAVSDDPVETLRRWTDAGAHWKVVGRHGDAVTIGLFRCDGGEEVDRFTSSDPGLLAYLDSQPC